MGQWGNSTNTTVKLAKDMLIERKVSKVQNSYFNSNQWLIDYTNDPFKCFLET